MYWANWRNIILICGIILFLWAWALFWYSINNEKLKDKEYMSDCEYTFDEWFFTVNAGCVTKKELPPLSLVDIVNETWNQIEWFSWYYEPFSTSFDYYWWTPIFKTEWNPFLKWDLAADQLIEEAIKWRKKIKISYNELAQYYAEHLSYFIADKDLTNLWKCTKTNYLVALHWIDGVILNPWNTFNMNEKLASLGWYCEWLSEQSFSFYWWVCGAVSQLFRVSLLDPDIIIDKRFSHNEWFVKYYWETVWWDDAAVYEYRKQFEIKNLWDSDIIIKTRDIDNWSMMVAISRPTNKYVNISKENIDWEELAIRLNKKVYYKDKNIRVDVIRSENFESYYSRKTYETR